MTGPVLRSLTLTVPVSELQENNETTPTVKATYSDGKTKQLSTGIAWRISDPNVLEAKGMKLFAKAEGTATVQVKVNGKLSPKKNITVYKVIHGHRLPPEPDPKINNSTLLGIDSNNNGVRDDVERLIIIEEAKNPHFPKTHTAISLQYAWAWQKMIENPTIESRKFLENASSCREYFFNKHTQSMGYLQYREWKKAHANLLGVRLEDILFNTKERIRQRFIFNEACSGNIFDSTSNELSTCQTNIDNLGE